VACQRKPIAIVDDDEDVLDATAGFLESLGYQTVSFNSGEAFLAYPDRTRIFCLLTDVNMPGLSGLELQAALRSIDPSVPVIMMTALRDDELRQRAILGGARELLRKPVMADDLIRCLESVER
jgi:FixJ family two-component response regulator